MRKQARAALSLAIVASLVSPGRAATAAASAPPAPPLGSYAPQPSVGKASIVGFTAPVQVQRAGQAGRENVKRLPVTLSPGDRVYTGDGGRALIQYHDGSESTIDAGASLSVEEEKADSLTVNLAIGKIWCAISKLANRRFRVRTPTAVASVRGTEFTVEAFGDKKTAVEVFGGLVSVKGALGDEALVGARQRIETPGGRLEAVQRFEARPDPRMPQTKAGPPGDRKGEGPDGKRGADGRQRDGKGPPSEGKEGPRFGFNPDHMKDFIAREAGRFDAQDQRESAAAFEQRNELYQTGKSLIDAFGRRVRVEEFVTRPAPDAFRFVSVSHRDDRTDVATVEVRANKALPFNLLEAGNLYGAPGADPPPYFAVQQRVSLRNLSTGASFVQIGVDGQPRQFNLPGQAFFDPTLNAFVAPSNVFWRTMFGNSYEFQNGSQGAIDRIWGDPTFRPLDNVLTMGTQVAGMTAHLQPVHVDIRNDPTAAINPNMLVGTYWVDSFVSRDPTDLSGTKTGLFYTTFRTDPLPGLAWTTRRIDYLDFTDTNGNGIMDFGEALFFDGRFGLTVYNDMVERANGTSLVTMAGGASRQVTGDNQFSGRDNLGNPVNSGPILTYGGGAVNIGPLLIFGLNNPRDRLFIDDFVIDNEGKIVAGQANVGKQGGALGRNFERRVHGTRFGGQDIDVVLSPAFLIQSGAANSGGGGGAVHAPGQPN